MQKYKIIEGDCEKSLDSLEPESIQCCITSPPYFNLRTYDGYSDLGREETPEKYVANMVRVFDKVRRVLKKDGTLWVVIGDSYVSNPVGTKHKDRVHGRSESGVFVSDGAAFKEVEGRRFDVTKHPTLKSKDLIGIPWRLAFALQADGWYLRSDIIWSKKNPKPEGVTDRPTKAHEYIFLLSKSKKYYYDADSVKEDADSNNGVDGKRHKRSVWTTAIKNYRGDHSAVYPDELIEPCVLAGCPAEGVVLDCFSGIGSTGIACLKNGRRYLGIEINPSYVSTSVEILNSF
jgi:DNA modification methylase